MADLESTGSSGDMEVSNESFGHLSQNPFDEERERTIFTQDVHRFMMEMGRPLSKIPIMGYKELDLYQLFKEVVARGGFKEVVRKVGTWSKIWKRLSNFDPSITDSSFRLKKNYERYLLEYEYHCFPSHRTPSDSPNRFAELDSAKKKRARKVKPIRDGRMSEIQAQLPLVLENGDLVIESLGQIVDRSPFVTDKHIYPIGYSAIRRYPSMKDPSKMITYTCEILNGGSKPQFVVTPSDDLNNPIIQQSPSAAWRAVNKTSDFRAPSPVLVEADIRRKEEELSLNSEEAELVQAAQADMEMKNREMTRSESPAPRMMCGSPTNNGESGRPVRVNAAVQFGLGHPLVSQLIQELYKTSSQYSSPRSREFGSGLKRKSQSEMSLVDLQGSDSEDEEFYSKVNKKSFSSIRRQPRRRCSNALEELSFRDEEDLVENAISTLLEFASMKTKAVASC